MNGKALWPLPKSKGFRFLSPSYCIVNKLMRKMHIEIEILAELALVTLSRESIPIKERRLLLCK